MIHMCSAVEFERLCRSFGGTADQLSLQVKGGSMYPFIRSGDCVDLQLLDGENDRIGKGDIVLFSKDGSLYLHRVLRREAGGFLVKGDMSFGFDGVVPSADVLARVVRVFGKNRRIDLSEPANRFLALVAAGTSSVWQYPVLAARRASDSVLAACSRVQGWRMYRKAVKMILPCAVSIREAALQDEEQLRDLYLMAGRDIREGLWRTAREGLWLVAELQQGRIAAGLTITRAEDDPGRWVIFGLEVKPLFRGMGIGRAIVLDALEKARAQGAREVVLLVNKKSAAALGLYYSLGFKRASVVPAGFNCSADEFCLTCALAAPPAVFGRIFSLLSKGAPEWDSLAQAAVSEGVFYPLYLYLNSPAAGAAEQIPHKFRERFRQIYYEHVSKNAAFSVRFKPVLDRIESLGIPVILFKGPAIDGLIYDDFFRPRLDLDLVVREEHMLLFEKALFGLGYAAPEMDKGYPLPEYSNSRLFIHSLDRLVPVHVHRHLVNNMFLCADGYLSMPMEDVWKRTEPFGQYRAIGTLEPEMNIIYLCEHGLKHDFEQLVFLYEIERLLHQYHHRFDWAKFSAYARQCGLDRAVYYGLYFIKAMLSADVPEDVLAVLKPKTFFAGEQVFLRDVPARKRRRYGAYPVYLAMRRGWVKKARFVLCTLFPPGFGVKGSLVRLRRWWTSCHEG